jgi:hypothetical protein
MTESDRPTDPHLKLTHDDLMQYLVSAVQRIEMQMASDEPPPWAKKLFQEMEHVKSNCKAHHPKNGGTEVWTFNK